MNDGELFCHLSSARIAELIRTAEGAVCYAGPGIQQEPAKAIAEVASRIGPELVTVSLDFDERVMRMGYGDIAAVQSLREAGVLINSSPGLRSALIIVDGEGYTFTPTPLYLEAETATDSARNALRLSPEQVAEALARLSPAAKAIAIARTNDPVEKTRIANLPVEVGGIQVDEVQFKQVDENLKQAPPVRFDLARQVRVFEPYLQYVELSLTGAAIQRHRLAIPASIQKLGVSKDLEGRLRTTFDLIEKGGKLSSKPLENALNKIRKNFTPSLGKDHGRVVLKSAKPILIERLEAFRKQLEEHQQQVGAELQKHLDESRQTIVDYYLPRVMEAPPDALLGQSLSGQATENGARQWLNAELDRVFPSAESLIQVMRLEERYKDVTFETLNREDFLQLVKEAFSGVDWDKAYAEFRAAGEDGSDAQKD
ncbi:hypothetical protein [Sedimenticola thiotaurini]|nr:hypothetical protein [Sedimenticola thiotaurini]